jgi:hypothetical protein
MTCVQHSASWLHIRRDLCEILFRQQEHQKESNPPKQTSLEWGSRRINGAQRGPSTPLTSVAALTVILTVRFPRDPGHGSHPFPKEGKGIRAPRPPVLERVERAAQLKTGFVWGTRLEP